MLYSQMSKEQLQAEKTALEKQYADFKAKGLKLDMSRGKPAPEQLNLSLDMLLHCLDGDYKSSNGIDCRNYGVLDGIPEAKALFQEMLGVSAEKAAQLIGCKTNALPVSALSDTDPDDDPLAWLLLDQHALTPEQAVYRQVCTEELERLFRTLSAKDRAILGHTYGVFGYEKLSADELGLREMLSPDGVTKARKAALERLRSRYPGSGLHLWRDVYHALKDISDI